MISRAKDTHTPNRVVRVDDELWKAAQEAATERGEHVSDVIRRALKRYVATNRKRQR